MDPIATARYGLTAATHRFEAAAAQIAGMRADGNTDIAPQTVEVVMAKSAFSANLSVIRFAQDMWNDLLRLHGR